MSKLFKTFRMGCSIHLWQYSSNTNDKIVEKNDGIEMRRVARKTSWRWRRQCKLCFPRPHSRWFDWLDWLVDWKLTDWLIELIDWSVIRWIDFINLVVYVFYQGTKRGYRYRLFKQRFYFPTTFISICNNNSENLKGFVSKGGQTAMK